MTYFIAMLAVVMLGLVLLPALRPHRETPQDTRRTELTEERELLLANLAELQGAGAAEHLLLREKVRLSQILHELDHLPPAPLPAKAGGALPLAGGVLLGVLLLLSVGSFTFFKSWRDLGLGADERLQLQSATRLPQLEKAAMQSKQPADYLAWGDAAWDAQNYEAAAKAYTQLLMNKEERDNAKALRRVGFFLLGNEKMAQDGLSFIARSVKLAPNDPESQLMYGYALGMFGQDQEAMVALKTFQKLSPGSRDADNMILTIQQRSSSGKVDGQLVYSQNCASCHGEQGQGGAGPKLAGAPALQDQAALRSIVLNGSAGMPAMPQLEGPQLDALVSYLQELK